MLVSQRRYALTACAAAALALGSSTGSAAAARAPAHEAAGVKLCSHSMKVGSNEASGVEANVTSCGPVTKLVRSYLAHPGLAPKGWKRTMREIPGAAKGHEADFVELRQMHAAHGQAKIFVIFTFSGK